MGDAERDAGPLDPCFPTTKITKKTSALSDLLNMSSEDLKKLLDEFKPIPPTEEEKAEWKAEAVERSLRPQRLRILTALEKQPDSYAGIMERLGIGRPEAVFFLSDLDQAELVSGEFREVVRATPEKHGLARTYYSITEQGKLLLKQVREAVT
jgi:DNA-binding MarR family transcriptional regulator